MMTGCRSSMTRNRRPWLNCCGARHAGERAKPLGCCWPQDFGQLTRLMPRRGQMR